MRIREILDPRHIVLDLQPGSKRELLTALSTPLARTRPSLDNARLVDDLLRLQM